MPSSLSSLFNCLSNFGKKPTIIHSATSPTPYNSDEKDAKCTIQSTSFLKLPEKNPSITALKTNRALSVVEKRQYEILNGLPYPTLHHETEVIIRTKAVGLNPIDWKSVDHSFCMPAFPWVNGREMAGVVEQIGSQVTDLKIGQRVWTSKYILL